MLLRKSLNDPVTLTVNGVAQTSVSKAYNVKMAVSTINFLNFTSFLNNSKYIIKN